MNFLRHRKSDQLRTLHGGGTASKSAPSACRSYKRIVRAASKYSGPSWRSSPDRPPSCGTAGRSFRLVEEGVPSKSWNETISRHPYSRASVRAGRCSRCSSGADLYIDITRPSADRRLELLAGDVSEEFAIRQVAQVRPNLHEPLDLFDRAARSARSSAISHDSRIARQSPKPFSCTLTQITGDLLQLF